MSFLSHIPIEFIEPPKQDITWKILSLTKGSNKTLYVEVNKLRFTKASSQTHEKMLRNSFIEKNESYRAMNSVTTLACSASVRNLLWNLTTSKFISPVQVSKINQDSSPDCPLCGKLADSFHISSSAQSLSFSSASLSSRSEPQTVLTSPWSL